MAEKRHVQHIRSNVVNNGQPKLPVSDSILYGEIAINYAKGHETLSIKNDNGDIVTIHPDEIQIGTSADTIDENAKVFIDTEMDNTVEVYTKAQIDSTVNGLTNKDEEQDGRLTALEEADISSETKVNAISGAVSSLTDSLTELSEVVANNIVIGNVEPGSGSDTELFVDTAEDAGLEVYSKAQVDTIVADLQRQINELKG